MQVEVRPLDLKKWHGKKDKESFTLPKAVEVPCDTDTGRYLTGLTEKEAEEYGKKLGGVNLNDIWTGEAHPFWSSKTAWIILPNHTMFLDTNKPLEYVKVKNMKAHKRIANSMKEWEEGKWPEATHVIFDEEEDVELKASKIALKDEAVKLKAEMSTERKVAVVQILSEKSVRGKSENFIVVELNDIIENKTSEFLRVARMDKEEVTIRANVLEALFKNILTKEQGAVYYMGELIGMNYEDAISWFKDPNNQKIKIAILEKLQK